MILRISKLLEEENKSVSLTQSALPLMTHALNFLALLGEPCEVATTFTFPVDPQKSCFIAGSNLITDGENVLAQVRQSKRRACFWKNCCFKLMSTPPLATRFKRSGNVSVEAASAVA